jgi:glyoxylase-like metal-dependent hydrolase (beta-lactamase superfamily II)
MQMPGLKVRGCLVLAVCLLSSPTARAVQGPREGRPPFVRQDAAEKISGHVWVISDDNVRFVPNVGIIVSESATLVVDTGLGERNGQIVLGEIAKLSSNEDIYVVMTHYHPEHAGGGSAFPASAQFVVSEAQERDLDELAAGISERFAGFSPIMGELLEGVRYRRGDLMFEREHTIDLGGVTVRFMSLGPTHTRGDTAIFVEEDGVLFAGDIVMNRTFLSFNSGSSGAIWVDVLDRFKELNPTTIVPSHGAIGGGALVDAQRRVVAAITERARELKAEGQSVEQAVTSLTLEFEAAYPDWSAPNRIGAAVRTIWAEFP